MSLKTKIVLIRVHWETETGSLLIVVQRFKVAFIWEIWLTVQETGRFVLFCIWETPGLSGRVGMSVYSQLTFQGIDPFYSRVLKCLAFE